MWYAADNYNYIVSHMCKKNLDSSYQILTTLPNISHIHENRISFEVEFKLLRPIASPLYILWQGHVRNLFFSILPVVSR